MSGWRIRFILVCEAPGEFGEASWFFGDGDVLMRLWVVETLVVNV